MNVRNAVDKIVKTYRIAGLQDVINSPLICLSLAYPLLNKQAICLPAPSDRVDEYVFELTPAAHTSVLHDFIIRHDGDINQRKAEA